MKTNRITKQQPAASSQFAPPSKVASRRGAGAPRVPVSQAEVDAWVERAKDLPDIRWDKVKAMREAIQNHTLDTDSRLVNLADRLPAELIEYFRQIGDE